MRAQTASLCEELQIVPISAIISEHPYIWPYNGEKVIDEADDDGQAWDTDLKDSCGDVLELR